jgi:hypothetical protein
MRKLTLTVVALGLVGAASAYAAKVQDWKDLDRVHNQIQHSIQEMERARAANHYDMNGHGAKAEDLLRQAEKELHDAIEAARAAK